MMSQADMHEMIRRRLAEHDIRYTGGRRAVIEAIEGSNGPQSAAELDQRITSVPLSSIYRTLLVLEEVGVLRKHHDADGLARFELAEWLAGHHHHVVCVGCGMVEDVELAKRAERVLDDLAEDLAQRAGYRLAGHVLEVEGTCRNCT